MLVALGGIAALVIGVLGALLVSEDLSLWEGETNGQVPAMAISVGALLAVAAGVLVVLSFVIVSLMTRAWWCAGLLALMLAASVFVVARTPSGPMGFTAFQTGMAKWAGGINTAPVNAWLAAKPAGTAPPPAAWAPNYSNNQWLATSTYVPVGAAPPLGAGPFPDEVYVAAGSGAAVFVYAQSGSLARFVVIGPAASTIPVQMHPAIDWKTIRQDLLIGVLANH